jgi:hypothetical protein
MTGTRWHIRPTAENERSSAGRDPFCRDIYSVQKWQQFHLCPFHLQELVLVQHNSQSFKILAYGYDINEETLEIRFSNGETFLYYHVTAEVYRAFGMAASKEEYYTRHIKHAGYSYATFN